MTDRITSLSRWALPVWLVTAFALPAGAQTVLWGTASATTTFPHGRLLRIGYATGTVQATFDGGPVGGGEVIGDGFTGVAVRPSNGQVFVADGFGSNRVNRFDPVSGAVLGGFQSPTGVTSIDALEFHNGELYASTYQGSRIIRINPDSGALIGELPVGLPPNLIQGGLTIADNTLFTRGATGNTSIARRDLSTGAVLFEFTTPGSEVIRGLATDGTSLFAASDTGVIYRLDFNGAVLDSRSIGIPLDGLGAFTPVPEPAAVGLAALAAVGVGYAWRRLRPPA